MPKSIPSLSSIGWVKSTEEKGDFALSYFITSEYSQSVIYWGNITSLQYLVKEYGNDERTLQTEVSNALSKYLRRYFDDDISVFVKVSEPDSTKPGQLAIQLNCIIRENGIEYSLGRRVELLNARVVKIANINNG